MTANCNYSATARSMRQLAAGRRLRHVEIVVGDSEIRIPRARARTMTAGELRRMVDDRLWAQTWASRYFAMLERGSKTIATHLITSDGEIAIPGNALKNQETLASYLAGARARLRSRRRSRRRGAS